MSKQENVLVNQENETQENIVQEKPVKKRKRPPFWWCNGASCIVAIVLMVVEYLLGNYSSIYAIGMVCFTWSSPFYFCQYFKVQKKKKYLVVAIIETFGLVLATVSYILYAVGVL